MCADCRPIYLEFYMKYIYTSDCAARKICLASIFSIAFTTIYKIPMFTGTKGHLKLLLYLGSFSLFNTKSG